MKKVVFFLICFVLIFATGCAGQRYVFLENGQNYYCPGVSYLDIVQRVPSTEIPSLQVRFTCTYDKKPFEISFLASLSAEHAITDHNFEKWGIGVIVDNDEQMVQLYETDITQTIYTRWQKALNIK